MCLIAVSSPVQETFLTVVENMINVTWSPPVAPNGIIYQHIVQQISPNDASYYHISGNKHSVLLPLFNVTRIFVTAVNIYGLSSQEFARSSTGL